MIRKFEDEIEIIEEIDEIFYTTYKATKVDLEIAKKMVENRINFGGERNMLVFIDPIKTKTTTKEARTFLGSKEAFKNVKAVAFFSDNAYTSFILNFILKVHLKITYNQIPIKIFNSKQKAIEWLTKYK